MPPITKDIPGEKEIFRTHASILILLGRLILVTLGIGGLLVIFGTLDSNILTISSSWIMLGVMVVGLVIALIMFLGWWTTAYRVTDKRVEARFGVIGFREREISMNDIQIVEVKQSFWGLLWNFGDITVRSAAREGKELILLNIPSPRPRARQIEDLAIGP
jgi:uncharacterized membrane protein YdbT with pleckstrin-like domain